MANEKRLIDANALEAAITTDYWEHFTRCHDTDQIALIDMVCEDIGNATTVDAVEVVRCKDCVRNLGDDDRLPRCTYWHEDVKPNFFCGHGERKDNE